MKPGMRSSDMTTTIAHEWVRAWTTGDTNRAQALLADNCVIEHNLDIPVDRIIFIKNISMLTSTLREVSILSLTATDERAALLYDCHTVDQPDSIRLAEFISLKNNMIIEIRRVYDITFFHALLVSPHDIGECE